MVVVSSFQTAATCKTIKILGNSMKGDDHGNNRKSKTSTNMDRSLAKLREALTELRDQDKDIYKQLVQLNKNIERLKEDIKIEEEKREEYDKIFYDDDDDDDSESEDDLEDEIQSEIQTEVRLHMDLMSPISGIQIDKQKELDEASVHERYDSGIIEDGNFTDQNQKNSTVIANDEADGGFSKQQIIKHKIDENMVSPIGKFGIQKHSLDEHQYRIEEDREGKPKLQRSQTLELNKVEVVRKKHIHTHRRSLSENQIRVDVGKVGGMNMGIDNAAFNATTPEMLRIKESALSYANLGHISEDSAVTSPWTMDDVKKHANARKLYRHKIPRDKNFNIIKLTGSSRFRDQEDPERNLLNSSLTQLNIHGAISSGTIKAIQRSVSVANCSVLGRNQTSGDILSKSLNMRRNENDKFVCRRTKSSSGLIRSGSDLIKSSMDFQSGFNAREIAAGSCKSGVRQVTRVASTISLV